MIKKLAVVLLISVLVGYGFLHSFFDLNVATSYLFTSGLLFINFVVLALMWKSVFIHKKSGLVTLVALMKYPLVGFSIFWAGRQPWLNSIGVVIGICAFLIIIVLTVLIKNKSKKTVN